jgi:hypothetical protein
MLTDRLRRANIARHGTTSSNYRGAATLARGSRGTGYPAPDVGGFDRAETLDHARLFGWPSPNTPRSAVEALAHPWGARSVIPQVLDLTLWEIPQVGGIREGSSAPGLTYPPAEALRLRGKGMHGTPADRLARAYTVEASGCWRWIKGRTTQGYGHFSIRSVYYQAHVLLYILHVGPPPAGLEPDHLCRNRWCVNPADIEWVTHAVNAQRGARSVLSPVQVEEIRRRGKAAGVRKMAREYGVNHATISRIVNGLIWPDPTSAEAAA